MTEIYIIKIEEGAKHKDIIYDYWINCGLKNGYKIKLFDWDITKNIHSFLNNTVMVRISALFVQTNPDEKLYSFRGKIIFVDKKYLFINDIIEIELTKKVIDENNILTFLNHDLTYYFGRLDIVEIKI
jgi:hypothetical protein